MKRIILTDDIGYIKNNIHAASEGSLFFVLKEDRRALVIRRYLSETLGMKAVTRREMHDMMGERFKSEFSMAIRSVNSRNGSLAWWSMNFTK